MEKIVEVKHLSKSYGSVQAVRDMSFYVERGKLFAFLGPNGAGKSTAINTICTFLKPDSGQVRVNGYELGKEDEGIQDSIGVVFQESLLDGFLTVKENLLLRGSFYEKDRRKLESALRRAARVTGTEEFLDRAYGKLSGGQRRRADIARALLHTPKILFLDEPTTGLDPQTRKNVWETIRRLQQEEGMTVFLTTHYMEEAEDADYCIIVDEGRIAAKGTPFDLKEEWAKNRLRLKGRDEAVLRKKLENCHISWKQSADVLEIELNDTKEALPILEQTGALLHSFTVEKGTMDDVFLAVTGKEIRE